MTITNVSGETTYWNNMEQAAGLAGDLLRMGAGKTPLLDKMGGLGTNGKLAKDWRFIMSNQYALEASTQKSRTETQASAGAPTQVTYDKDQEYNVCQIFQYEVDVTWPAMSATSYLDGLALSGALQQPTDPTTFQLRANMEQMAMDFDWHIINGTYNAASTAGQANQMRGLKEAISTNKVNADSGYTDDILSTKMVDDAMILLADTSKAPMQDMWILCGAGTKQRLSKLYGNTTFAGPRETVGGQAIETINTDFGPLKLMYEPQVTTGYLYIVDMAYLAPVFLPVPGKGAVSFTPLAQAGAAQKGMLYGQMSYTYTAEKYHGQIYGFDLT